MLPLLDSLCLPASRSSGSAARSDESASMHMALCTLLIECSDLVAEDAAHRFAAPSSSWPASPPLAALCLIMRSAVWCYSYAARL